MSTIRVRRLATASVAAAAAITGVGASTVATAQPNATSPALVITVKYAHKQLNFSPGTSFQAGRVTFTFTARKGDHTLQIIRLHHGYTKQDFGRDASAGLDKGDTDAIRRVDHRVTWLGGAESVGGNTGQFSTLLKAGKYFAFDQNSDAVTKLTVSGPIASRPGAPSTTKVIATHANRWNTPRVLPADGWIKLRNRAVEPHFFVALHVKKSTTAQMVRKYVKSGSEEQPPWGLPESTDSGAFSPGTTTAFHIDLPKGKYVIACFWPDKDTGMPHFSMGMWKLVHLR